MLGWKEFELEVMRDAKDNAVIVCSIENLDPMGVHTGDSITVAPAMTLTDKEYQRMRDAAIAIMREIGVDDRRLERAVRRRPADRPDARDRDEPARVASSSALASKATGFPIAKIAAKLAIGYTLDELDERHHARHAGVVRADDRLRRRQVAALRVREVPAAQPVLGPQMKTVGEAMAIGRTFREALGKAIRSLETGRAGFDLPLAALGDDLAALERAIAIAVARPAVPGRRAAFQLGLTVERAHELTRIDPWFLHHVHAIALAERELGGRARSPRSAPSCATLQAARAQRPPDRRAHRRDRGGGPRRAPRRRRAPGLQARRHLRRRVRGAHAVPLLVVRGRVRGAADRPSAR